MLSGNRRLRWSVGLIGVGLAAVTFSPAGCSLIAKNDADQCSSDADCKGFKASRCDQNSKICVPDISLSDSGSDGTAGSAGGAGGPSCTTNAECATLGNHVCREGACKNVNSQDCIKLYGAEVLKEPDVVLFGALSSLSGPTNVTGLDYINAAGLAHDELQKQVTAKTVTAIPNTTLIGCDEDDDPTRALNHLADLGVRVVIGPLAESTLFTLLPVAKERNVTLVTPLAESPLLEEGENLTAIKEGRLINVRPNRTRTLVYIKSAIDQAYSMLETKFPAQFGTLRLAVLATKDPSTQDYANALKPILNYPGVQFYDFAGLGTQNEVAQKVVAQDANLVLFAADDDSWEAVIKAIESLWPTGGTKPWYFTLYKPQQLAIQLGYKNILPNVMGLDILRPGSADSEYNVFYGAFNQKYGKQPIQRTENAYDAWYVSAYGWIAAQNLTQPEQPTGADFVKAVDFLFNPPGLAATVSSHVTVASAIPVPVQPTIDISGGSGPLDFDLTVGSPPAGGLLYCWKAPDGPNFCDTGYTFDATTGAVGGTASPTCSCF